MGGGVQAAAKPPQIKALLLIAVVVVLAGLVGYALKREMAPKPAPTAAAHFTGGLGAMSAPALSADEEAFAASLWPIHSEVKLAAVRMIFAGLHYKTEKADAALLKEKVQPLTGTFSTALTRARQLQVPASLSDAHESYLEALQLYVAASREMIRVANDGRDEHLILAQQKSEQASLKLLKLSDLLWPGEYKPN
jgi:hypothetical protein